MKKVGVISLGCDKNRVDTERMLKILANNEFEIVNEMAKAEIIIINTCAFLETSRVEAIDTIMECFVYKQTNLEKLIVSGCLPTLCIDDLFDDLIEVDAFLGYTDYDLLPQIIREIYEGKRVKYVGVLEKISCKERILSTPNHYAYLKVSEGCNNHCTYCLIPKIRGKFRSESIEELALEASNLGDGLELILVAQDLTRYGEDLYGEKKLVKLLKELSKLDNIDKIRLLYCYPDSITDELIFEIKNNDKIIKYIDIPFQHANNKILKLMNRKGTFEGYLALIEKLKNEIKGIAIRSTFIIGFPSESEEEFNDITKFLKLAKMHNVGFFAYSREEGTPAYNLKNQVDEKVKIKRIQTLAVLQKEIVKEINSSYIGETLEVVCEGIDYDKNMFISRAYFNAPLIDGKVYFKSKIHVIEGEKYMVKIKKIKDYDLIGETI